MTRDPGETTIGGPLRDFPSTSWGLLRSAREENRRALERLIELYWKPAYFYIRAAGRRSVEDAKDLTQEFFARMLERRDWERLRPERGSFRGFLKKALRNFMTDAARRERARRPPDGTPLLRFEDLDDRAPAPPPGDPETVFDREWERTVLEDSLRELEDRLRRHGASALFDVFRLYCLEGEGRLTYAEVAERLGLRESDVRKRLARCRAELREIVLGRVKAYAADEQEAQEEYRRIVGP
ncbi:MAG TPA: sigma-70 family RNA polymerase sigma factor [Planctomycetota bacterium]|nr:sigma-70 family RNA polymerase sigma factor [Planctomycetota bacterium]